MADVIEPGDTPAQVLAKSKAPKRGGATVDGATGQPVSPEEQAEIDAMLNPPEMTPAEASKARLDAALAAARRVTTDPEMDEARAEVERVEAERFPWEDEEPHPAEEPVPTVFDVQVIEEPPGAPEPFLPPGAPDNREPEPAPSRRSKTTYVVLREMTCILPDGESDEAWVVVAEGVEAYNREAAGVAVFESYVERATRGELPESVEDVSMGKWLTIPTSAYVPYIGEAEVKLTTTFRPAP